jgi:hypothetical protein
MFFRRSINRLFVNFKYDLVKRGVTSGGSRASFKFKRTLPICLKLRQLGATIRNNAGRSSSGHVILSTKKSRTVKKSGLNINYNLRLRYVGFIGSINIASFTHKIISLFFLSTGSVTYVPTSCTNALFRLTRMYRVTADLRAIRTKFKLLGNLFFINQGFFLIKQIPKKQRISLLEVTPGQGVRYVRSPLTSAIMTKIDFKANTTLVKLPSGVRKVFSLFSVGSVGKNPLIDQKYWKSNKAGYFSSYGVKPKVRGVAMNPIDHPHGGRAKSISYQRTPWGKTTKFK